MEIFTYIDTWVALLTLTFLEIILGIDNIVFISITAGKLPEAPNQKSHEYWVATRHGIQNSPADGGILSDRHERFPSSTSTGDGSKASVSGQSLILLGGGIFLLYKSTREIHHKVEGIEEQTEQKIECQIQYGWRDPANCACRYGVLIRFGADRCGHDQRP